MTLIEFTKCAEPEQLRLISNFGILLAERTIGYNRLYLYALSSFYIELYYELYEPDKTSVSILRSFEDIRLLDEYLDVEKPILN